MPKTVAGKTKYGTQPFYDAMYDEGYNVRTFAKACGKTVTIGDVKLMMHGHIPPTPPMREFAPKILDKTLEELFTPAALRDAPDEREIRAPRVYFEAEVS